MLRTTDRRHPYVSYDGVSRTKKVKKKKKPGGARYIGITAAAYRAIPPTH